MKLEKHSDVSIYIGIICQLLAFRTFLVNHFRGDVSVRFYDIEDYFQMKT